MKILLLSESIAGSGHMKAAENVAKGIHLLYPSAEIKIDTALSQVSPLLENWTSRLYMGTIRYASGLWGWAYRRDRQWGAIGKRALSEFVSSRLASYIKKEKPDIVVSTHAFCLGGLALLKKNNVYNFTLGAALTDYCVNPFWVHSEVDVYFVGADLVKQKMVNEYSFPSEKIYVTGIPIDPMFNSSLDGNAIRRKLGISDAVTLILATGGGLGLAPYQEVLQACATVPKPIFLVLLTGTNQQMKRNIEIWVKKNGFPHPFLVLDYVKNMHEWMKAADLLIGKPGGLTVSESFACQLPLLIYKPIPGQEERNSQFLLDSKLAMRADTVEELSRLVTDYCCNARMAEQMKGRIGDLCKPDSALNVGSILIQTK